MKNEFVPYEEALAMKELGFDEMCVGHYQTFEGNVINFRQWKAEVCERLCKKDNFIKAPLYQQAFRWFREKYSWNSWVDQGFTESFRYNICESNGSIIGVEGFSTYEEAELACLQKLIEIVTQNKAE